MEGFVVEVNSKEVSKVESSSVFLLLVVSSAAIQDSFIAKLELHIP